MLKVELLEAKLLKAELLKTIPPVCKGELCPPLRRCLPTS
jgi:hypothetical protein